MRESRAKLSSRQSLIWQKPALSDLDSLTADQMQTIFELYAAHAIETRLCNDIGMKAISFPADAARAASVQRQLLGIRSPQRL